MKKLRVLSLGAGVQSSTLALMVEKGEIPKVDCGIFADVGGEPQTVYDHLEYLKKQVSYPIHIVQWRDLKKDVISASNGHFKGFTAPFFSQNIISGKKSMLMRQCTNTYKIQPIIQKIRFLLGYSKGQRVDKDVKVELLMGISFDEMQRMKINQLKYIENIYPLVELAIRRRNCIEWLNKNGYQTPPRSACTFCPYHTNAEWREIKKNKKEWEEVVKIDKMIRDQEKYKKNKDKIVDKIYLHRDCKPIDEVDLRTDEEKGQYSLLDECDGICGV